MTRLLVLIASLVLAGLPRAAGAQAVEAGVRVRLFAPALADTALTGTVASRDSLALLLVPSTSAEPVRIELAGLHRLEVSRGRRPATLQGAIIGAAAGAAAGFLVASTASQEDCEFVCGAAKVGMSVAGGGLGMLMGAMIGSSTGAGPERWRAVPVRD